MILLTRNTNKQVEIDDSDYSIILKHGNYALIEIFGPKGHSVVIRSSLLKRSVVLSRLIMNCPCDNGYDIDHKDGNVFNNKRSNLRMATFSQNNANRPKIHHKSTSKYKGVSFEKRRKHWRCCIMVNFKQIYLGKFDNEIIAALAYDNAARKYFGEFACCNYYIT